MYLARSDEIEEKLPCQQRFSELSFFLVHDDVIQFFTRLRRYDFGGFFRMGYGIRGAVSDANPASNTAVEVYDGTLVLIVNGHRPHLTSLRTTSTPYAYPGIHRGLKV